MKAEWKNLEDEKRKKQEEPTSFLHYVKTIQRKMNSQRGDELPVSEFVEYADGTMPVGTAAFEKRGVGIRSPRWNPEGCVQCNACSLVCPHACIRPFLVKEGTELKEGFKVKKAIGKDYAGYNFRIQLSPLDCTGCGNCAEVCPAKEKGALTMAPFEEMKCEQPLFDQVAMNEKYLKKDAISDKSVKNAQFAKPYYQFSSACAGCAETTYIKLLSQLFGDHMYISNATGC